MQHFFRGLAFVCHVISSVFMMALFGVMVLSMSLVIAIEGINQFAYELDK